MHKNLAIALSLANLCFLETWSRLLDPSYRFFVKSPPRTSDFAVVILGVMLLGSVVWGALACINHGSRVFSRAIGLGVVLLVLLTALISLLSQALAFFGVKGWLLVLVLLLMIVSWQRRLLKVVATIALIMLPFVPVTFAQAGWALVNPDVTIALADKAPAPPLPPTEESAPRVLWLVFDEMDQRLTFLERPPRLRLAELDRFRNHAIYGANAEPPSRWTQESMPALIAGKLISKAKPAGANELMITLSETDEPVGWSTVPNVFSRARELGFNTALVGCYLPYCRVIGDSLTACSWNVMDIWINYRVTLWDQVRKEMQNLPRMIPFAKSWGLADELWKRQPRRTRQKQMSAYLSILEEAKRMATNPGLGLILVHWPVPHLPVIYDASKDDFSLGGNSNYLDNLELVDRTIGELRRAMEAAGAWDNTTVLITADHSWRTDFWGPVLTREEVALAGNENPRVPFLLKLAGQEEAVTYEPAFNTVLTHDLLLALLGGDLSTPEGVVAWIDQQRLAVANLPSRDD